MTKNHWPWQVCNWLLVLGWMGLIFFLSAQPDLKSTLPSLVDFILRKLAHMTEYAILCWLLFRAWRGQDVESKKALGWSLFFSIFYASSDEYHQTFVHGRHGVPTDVLIDAIGAAIGSLILRK